jgi:hypothetical protein
MKVVLETATQMSFNFESEMTEMAIANSIFYTPIERTQLCTIASKFQIAVRTLQEVGVLSCKIFLDCVPLKLDWRNSFCQVVYSFNYISKYSVSIRERYFARRSLLMSYYHQRNINMQSGFDFLLRRIRKTTGSRNEYRSPLTYWSGKALDAKGVPSSKILSRLDVYMTLYIGKGLPSDLVLRILTYV